MRRYLPSHHLSWGNTSPKMCMSPLVALNPSGEHILLALVWLVNVGLGWQLLLLLLPFDRFLPGGLHHQILYAASSMPGHRGGEEGAGGGAA